jgi:hypothetical protein
MRIIQPTCDCPAHRLAPGHTPVKAHTGAWSVLLPILACAVCPACLATYAKLFSVFGVGFGMSDSQHLVLLTIAVLASLGVSAYRSWRSQRWWPVATASFGAALIVAGHVAGDLHELEWAGVVVLLVGGLREHFRLRAHGARHALAA